MVQRCKIKEVKHQLRRMESDKQARAYSDAFSEMFLGILRETRIRGRVINNGSTHESRMTFVLDPISEYKPFPPDIDLKVIIDASEIPEDLENILLRSFQKAGHVHKDEKHDKTIGVMRAGDFNISLAVYTKAASLGNKEFNYNDTIEPFDEHQRLEARTLKIILQRAGCYGNYNRAISGIAVDEMIRRFKTVEGSLEFIEAGLKVKSDSRLLLPETRVDLMENVGKYTRERLTSFFSRYREGGLVNARAFESENWQELNPEKITFAATTPCAPGSCGREGSSIARAVDKYMRDIAAVFSVSRGIDYFVIPCQGKIGGQPHTSVYASFDKKNRNDIDEVAFKKLFNEVIRLYSN